ncbi:MAG: hypothetical protein ACD_50C00354G0001 [uncultured bacterium]|nr:MAG: hypothetical protein ACD_50C00354G0001 [uncultured bacterium]
MVFHILTIFPKIFDSYFSESILARAQKYGKIKIKIYDIRNFTEDKHKTVDDAPYGGGPGMVMKVEPIYKCLKNVKKNFKKKNSKIILTSARGKQFDQKTAQYFSKLDNIMIICGRYEGIDQRVADHLCDEEISIGPYILNGGELPAMVIVEAISRFIPGVLGNKESLEQEKNQSMEHAAQNTTRRSLDPTFPQYTKPENFKRWKVPAILLSGDHGKIAEWRKKQRKWIK